MSDTPAPMKRADFIPAPSKFNLSAACRFVWEAFGGGVYLVGSSITRRDFRDVDIRVILDDAEFDRMFPSLKPTTTTDAEGKTTVSVPTTQLNAKWALLCSSISLWLSQHSGLPVDFQIQRQTQANEQHKGPRYAIGIYYAEKEAAP